MLQDKLEADLKRFIDYPIHKVENEKIILSTIVESLREIYKMIWNINSIVIRDEKNLSSVIEHLFPNHTSKLPELPKEEFISLPEFVENYRLISEGKRKIMATTGTISATLRMDEDLVKFSANRGKSENRWFIKPLHYIHYMAQSKINPRLRKRCKEWLKQNKQI